MTPAKQPSHRELSAQLENGRKVAIMAPNVPLFQRINLLAKPSYLVVELTWGRSVKD